MEKGKIILLNGVSSSGKTTIAKALQERFQEPYFWFSIDTFCNMVSMRYFNNAFNGDVFNKIYKAFNHTISSFSDMGMHCIVDAVFLNIPGVDNNLHDFVKQLDGHEVLFVHVHCPLSELQIREKKRGDREIGQAKSQLDYLQLKELYDVSIDTFEYTTDECVDRIIEAYNLPEKYSAFLAVCKELG